MKNILKKDILNLDYYKIAYESKLEKQLAKLPKTIKFRCYMGKAVQVKRHCFILLQGLIYLQMEYAV